LSEYEAGDELNQVDDGGRPLARRARSAAADLGQRGDASTYISTRKSLHDARESVGCVSSVTSAERWRRTSDGEQGGLKAQRMTIGQSHNETHFVGLRAVRSRAFGLQNGCRSGVQRGSVRKKSLEISGSAYGIRTHVTAVRGRPGACHDGTREVRLVTGGHKNCGHLQRKPTA
jgi:hypothetical protein